MRDVVFDPIKTGFTWTDGGVDGMGWYEYDTNAEKTARRDRDAFAREQRAAGKTVRCSTSPLHSHVAGRFHPWGMYYNAARS